MIYKKVYLDENKSDVYLDIYVADKIERAFDDGKPPFVRNAILVIPGGGYENVCSDREGEPIAMAFMPYGYNAFVLHYSVKRSKTFPGQLIEASLAVKHIKDHAEEYNIDPDKVFVTGFSAGGHLAASLGTMWHKQEVYDAMDMPFGYNKPAGMILVYPVISGNLKISHAGSFCNLIGSDNPTAEQLEMCSIEKNVDEKSVPAYIVHTSNDSAVNVKNSLVLADAYASLGRTFELHIYPDAPHGMALGNAITECGIEKFNNPCLSKWVENAVMWAERL